VFDGCASYQDYGFVEQQICAFGVCHIWIPTQAKHSGASTFYVTLEGKGYDVSPAARDRNDNTNAEKPTVYTLNVVLGSANCGSPPSSGFCAGTDDGFNVWSEITTSSIWTFVRPDLADAQASCLYDELRSICPTPTETCLQWLKVFSCLETFPQCDSNGYQVPTCVDVCNQVNTYCGDFFTGHSTFSCCSDRYVEFTNNTASTCYTIPAPAPPPVVQVPVLYGDPSSSLPPPLEVPVFSTIFAYFPPASEFVKEADVAKEVLVSSSSIFAPLLSMVALMLLIVLG